MTGEELLALATKCPVCGADLEDSYFNYDQKECPDSHGYMYTTENSMGLPVLAFAVS